MREKEYSNKKEETELKNVLLNLGSLLPLFLFKNDMLKHIFRL